MQFRTVTASILLSGLISAILCTPFTAAEDVLPLAGQSFAPPHRDILIRLPGVGAGRCLHQQSRVPALAVSERTASWPLL
jgi:hypothetical protein